MHFHPGGFGTVYCPEGAAGLSPGLNHISANLMRGASMGEWLLSRRDRLIVARHEVPG